MGGLQGAIHVVVTDGLFSCYGLLCPTQSRNCFFKMTRKHNLQHTLIPSAPVKNNSNNNNNLISLAQIIIFLCVDIVAFLVDHFMILLFALLLSK